MFGSKPATGLFGGAANTSFGSTGFGVNNTPFGGGGTVGFGGTTFGTPAQTGGGLFGQQATGATGPFGGTTNFGAASNATAPFNFGAGVQTSNQTSTGLFGGATNTGFGTSTLFGQPAQQQQQQATGFGQTGGLGMFGATGGTTGFLGGAQQTGTTIKFVPVTGTDVMMKSGLSTNVSTKLQCITGMKEYEAKSLEELRVEDYLANRKSGQLMGGGFGSTSVAGGGFMQPVQPTSFSLFGNQNKPTFAGFGTSSAASTSLFGGTQQAKPLFGGNSTLTTTTASNAFGGLGGGTLFGNNANKPGGLFGATTTTQQSLGFFGNTQATGGTGFGLGAQNNTSGLFGGNKLGGFGQTATTSSAFSFGVAQPNQSTLGGAFGGGNLFNKPATTSAPAFGMGTQNTSTLGFGGFGNTATTLGTTNMFGNLGATNTGGSLFGQQKPAGSLFGGGTTGFGLNTGLGANTNTLGGLGATNNTLLGGNMTGGSLFGGGTSFLGGQQQQQLQQASADAVLLQQQQQIQQHIQALNTSPYGDSPLFKNFNKDQTRQEELLKPTNPEAQKASLVSKLRTSSNGLNRPKIKIKPQQAIGKANLFDGLDQEESSHSPSTSLTTQSSDNETFVPRRNFKQLNIKVIKQQQLLQQQQSNNGAKDTNQYQLSSGVEGSNSVVFEQHNKNKSNGKSFDANADKVDGESINNTMAELIPKGRNAVDTSENNEDRQSNSTDQSENYQPQINRPPHPAGVVLTRPDYFTLPTLEEMVDMVDKDGRCVVEDFVIGREGYGNVYFPGKTDVSNMNLDEIVHFRRKEVEIYPSDANKPPVGEGLNKKAQVTLDRVYPMDKTTGELITDYGRLVSMGYMDKLERSALKMNARFVEYRPTTGSFVFLVNHFSKYTLCDDSDDDLPVDGQPKLDALDKLQQVPQQQLKTATTTATTIQSADYLKQQDQQFSSGMTQQFQKQFIQQLDNDEMMKTDDNDDGGRVSKNKMVTIHEGTKDGDEDEDGDGDIIKHHHFYRKDDGGGLLQKRMKDITDDKSYGGGDDDEFDGYDKENRYPMYNMMKGVSAHSIQLQKASFFGEDDDYDDDGGDYDDDVMRKKRISGKLMDVSGRLLADQKVPSKTSSLLNVDRNRKDIMEYDTNDTRTTVKEKILGKLNQKLQTLSTIPSPYQSPHPALPSEPMPEDTDKKIIEIFRKNRKRLISKVNLRSCFLLGSPRLMLGDAGLYHGGDVRVGWKNGGWTICHSSLSLASPISLAEKTAFGKTGLMLKSVLHKQQLGDVNNTNASKLSMVHIEQVDVPGSCSKNDDRKALLEACLTTELNHCKVLRSDDDMIDNNNPNDNDDDDDVDVHMNAGDNDETRFKSYENLDAINCPFVSYAQDAQSLMLELVEQLKSPKKHSYWSKTLVSALELCLVLWGKMADDGDDDNNNDVDVDGNVDDSITTTPDDGDDYFRQKKRKDRLSRWLTKEVEERVAVEIQNHQSMRSKIEDDNDDGTVTYLYMTGRLMEEAVLSALEVKDYHLALLISQAIGNDEVRMELKKQLVDWTYKKTDSFISQSRLSIFSLLSGSLVLRTSHNLINCCEHLDWKRCFSLHLWYACPATCLISEALQEYEASFQGDGIHGNISSPPLPSYLEAWRGKGLADDEVVVGGTYDVIYHLLKLFCMDDHPLHKLLSPQTMVDDELDYSGSWHLMKVLESINLRNLSVQHHMYICQSYASQLESLGLWWWSVFVLMHITQPIIRKDYVKKVISRNIEILKDHDDDDDDCNDDDDVLLNVKEKFVIDKLKIPVEWLYEAKAIKCHHENKPHLEAKYSFLARNYHRYHDIVIGRHIASRIVINEDRKSFNYWVGRLKVGGRCGEVFKDREVAVYLEYMELLDLVDRMQEMWCEVERREEVNSLRLRIPMLIDSLKSRLGAFSCKDSTDRLAYMKMHRVLLRAMSFNELQVGDDLSTSTIRWKFPLSYDSLPRDSSDDIIQCLKELLNDDEDDDEDI